MGLSGWLALDACMDMDCDTSCVTYDRDHSGCSRSNLIVLYLLTVGRYVPGLRYPGTLAAWHLRVRTDSPSLVRVDLGNLGTMQIVCTVGSPAIIHGTSSTSSTFFGYRSFYLSPVDILLS